MEVLGTCLLIEIVYDIFLCILNSDKSINLKYIQ